MLSIIILLIISINFFNLTKLSAQEIIPNDFLKNRIKSETIQDSLDEYLLSARAQLGTGSSGITLSSLIDPRVGRFVMRRIDAPDGAPETCSATLIRPNIAITAAHCVCDNKTQDNPIGFSDCDASSSTQNVMLVFPAFGIKTISKIDVNPNYISPNTQKYQSGEPVGDIAILTLSEHVTNSTVLQFGQVSRPEQMGVTLFVPSFGIFATSGSPRWMEVGLSPNTEYTPGLGHFSQLNAASVFSPGLCAGQASDVICVKYDPDYSPHGSSAFDDSVACHSDSGSPLLAKDANGTTSLVGILSYVDPPDNNCAHSDHKSEQFVDIIRYTTWINSLIDKEEKVISYNIYCGENLIFFTNGVDIEYKNVLGVLNVQVARPDGTGPTPVRVDSSNFSCNGIAPANVISCKAKSTGFARVTTAGAGLMQVSICSEISHD